MAITGSVQEKNGKWYAVLNLKENGKRKQKWVNTGLKVRGNKKNAEKFLAQQITKYSNLGVSSNSVLLADYFENWLIKIESEVRPNTYRSYKGNMQNHIIPYFRALKTKLQELCPVNLEAYYKQKVGEGLSETTVKHHHQNISKALSDAVHDMIIPFNPASAARTPTPKKYKAKFLTPSELNQLLLMVKGLVIELPVKLCSIYGFRRSEVLGLRWEHISFENRTLTVAETLQQHPGGSYVDEPKTESSYRTLPLTDKAYKLLKTQKEKQEEHARIMGDYYSNKDYVCSWANGKAIQPNYLTKNFHKILKESNLPMVRLHDLRHSTASNLLNAGGLSVVQVSDWLGHSSPTTTLNYYAHTNQAGRKEVADKLDKMLNIS